MNSAQAAGYTFTMMLTAMGTAVLSGFISAKLGNIRKALAITGSIITTLATALIVLALSGGIERQWVAPCYILLALNAIGVPMFVCLIKELNPPESAATSVGVYNSLSYLAIAVFTTLAGQALDRFSANAQVTANAVHYPAEAYRFICIGLLALSLCSVILSFAIKETRGCNTWAKK